MIKEMVAIMPVRGLAGPDFVPTVRYSVASPAARSAI